MSPYTWRPVEVLVEDGWVPGWLVSRRRDPDCGSRALVEYTVGVGMTYHPWRPAAEFRPR